METKLFTSTDVTALLTLPQCISAVEDAFARLAAGEASAPAALSVHSANGGFHIKAGILARHGRRYFAVKTNGNFPGNRKLGLPTIQGMVMLADADDGRVLGVMDSIAITALRTAAATAVAARHLARPESGTAVIAGCGVQGRVQLRALADVLPISQVFAYDIDAAAARQFAADMSARLAIPITPTTDLGDALARADVCVTCTTATEFMVFAERVRPGTFIAGVGVDNENKRELAPEVLARAKVVTDSRAQCAQIGDLHHALSAGVLTLEDVHADLADVVAGNRPGRESSQEIIVFDSTGIGLLDVAAAAATYETAAGPATGSAV